MANGVYERSIRGSTETIAVASRHQDAETVDHGVALFDEHVDDPHRAFDAVLHGPHYGKGPKGYRRSDARILEDVCDRIADDGWVDASDVEVDVLAGVLTLRGTVRSRNDKRRLEDIVVEVHGLEAIHNDLRTTRARLSAGVLAADPRHSSTNSSFASSDPQVESTDPTRRESALR
jgi:hypothetical protein